MKRILFSLLIAVTMLITGCDDTLYEVYNDFTGPVESVALPATMSVEVHTSEKLKASVYPTMTENKNVTWSSADASIASVDSDGVVTGNIVDQSTVITVTTEEGGFTAQCTVTVVPRPIPITSLTLPETLSVATGQQRTLSYSYTPSDATKATNSYMTWKSSNTAVAAVDGDGTVTGVTKGTATVTVKSTEWDKSAECTVTVGDPTYAVTYNMNTPSGAVLTGSTIVDSKLYKTGEDVTLPGAGVEDSIYAGYTLIGWSVTTTSSVLSIGETYTVSNKDLVFYARWDAKSYTIAFNNNDSSGIATGTTADNIADCGSEVTLTSNGFTRPGFNFAGWATSSGGSVVYSDGQSVTMGSSNITLYAKWTWKTYNLRDTGPAGGWIFYINPNADSDGWKYLEAAPADNGTGIWDTSSYPSYINGSSALPDDIGEGKSNTLLIVNKLSSSAPAAYACDTYSVTVDGVTFSDWFLPSKNELVQMYTNIGTSVYGFRTGTESYYWNSSEISANGVSATYFGDGKSYSLAKNSNYSTNIRSIRRF